MRAWMVLGLGVSLMGCLAGQSLTQTLPLPEALVPLNSPRGALLLRQSQAQADYIPLTTHFVTQDNQAFCGVASMVMVLNALNVDRPSASAWEQRYFIQANILNPETEKVIPKAVIEKQGMTLAELAGVLEKYPVQAQIYYGGETSVQAFRQLAIENLKNPDNFILINYLRRTIGQERGGHISPIAAYNAATDQFLVLDVSRYKYPPVWVKAEVLWQSMNTVDRVSGKTRGFLLVQRRSS